MEVRDQGDMKPSKDREEVWCNGHEKVYKWDVTVKKQPKFVIWKIFQTEWKSNDHSI